MSTRDQRIGVWCGPIFAALLGAALLMAGWLPPPSPSQTPAEVAAMYQANTGLIRLGMLIMMGGAGLVVPFVAAIAMQMRRMQGISRFTMYLQMGAGSAGALLLLLPPIVLATAAFRPDRDPQILSALNDLGWLLFITPFSLALVQNFAIAGGIFMDRSPRPVFPRWLGYLNIWVALLFVPGGFAFFFKSGPFGWNGLLAFWVAAAAFFIWFLAMTIMLFKAIRQEEGAA